MSSGVEAGATLAEVFNHGEALFQAKTSEVIDWALGEFVKNSSASVFTVLDLKSSSGKTLLHRCVELKSVPPNTCRLLKHQLMEW